MRAKAAAATTLLALLLALGICIFSALLRALPGVLDAFLLADDAFCRPAAGVGGGMPPSGVQVDYGEGRAVDDERWMPQRQRQLAGGWRERLARPLLGHMVRRLWEGSAAGDDDSASLASTCPIPGPDGEQTIGDVAKLQHYGSGSTDHRWGELHPLCRKYRALRTRLRFERLWLPWDWHYRAAFRVEGLALHSLSEEVAFVPRIREELDWRWRDWRWWRDWRRDEGNAVRVDAVPLVHGRPADQHALPLPPAMEVEAIDVSFHSWVRPVVSTHWQGATINVVLHKGGFVRPTRRSKHGPWNAFKGNGAGLSIGAMSVEEALYILPRPPKARGLYPRIGLVNITNVSLCVYEREAMGDNGTVTLRLLLKARIPDKVFGPVANLTSAHLHAGIDRMDFQPLLETALADALRRHLLREAVAGFHDRWSHAHAFVARAQALYLDRWIGTGARAWRQAQENVRRGVVDGTAPLVRAAEEWAAEVKEIVAEPGPPLAVIVAHYWNRTVEGINKHSVTVVDGGIRAHLLEMMAKSNRLGHERRVSKHWGELKDAFDGFVAKSGQDIELLVEGCEREVKDMWLAWHRQFLPEM